MESARKKATALKNIETANKIEEASKETQAWKTIINMTKMKRRRNMQKNVAYASKKDIPRMYADFETPMIKITTMQVI